MITAKVVETSVNINNNSPSQESTNMDDLHLQTCNDTPGLKPQFKIVFSCMMIIVVSLFFFLLCYPPGDA